MTFYRSLGARWLLPEVVGFFQVLQAGVFSSNAGVAKASKYRGGSVYLIQEGGGGVATCCLALWGGHRQKINIMSYNNAWQLQIYAHS